MRAARDIALAAVSALVLGTAACAPGPTAAQQPTAAPGQGPLAGVCPDPVVIQTDWFAEAEYGAYFQLLGDGPRFDTERKRISAQLVDAGAPTGVDLEIRYGGPAIGFQQVSAQLYADQSITLGLVSTDEAIQNSAQQPTTAVVAPLDISPLMIMWDRTRHPDVASIADLGRLDVPVLYYQTDTYMEYLLGTGLLKREQVDGSYDGGPSRWVTADGVLAQVGFATSEPYIYRNELGGGRSYDVNLQLVNDTGFPTYPMALSVRSGELPQLAPCLRALVPMVQRAATAFATGPARVQDVIVQAVAADRSSVWSYSPGLADYAVRTMVERDIIGNGPNATLGDMEPSRVTRLIELLDPVFTGQNKPIKAGLTVDQVATNEFIDPAIGLR